MSEDERWEMREMPQPLVFLVAYRFDLALIVRAGAAPPCPAEMYETFLRAAVDRSGEVLARDMVSALLSIW
ncbi:hypothetical protein UP10_12685 [Bradyrhizobium sp. LTSPM299]|nr:hypothetical protein UP10_12685 [Bradyrhizobium sp. LTSPM299]